MEVTLDDDAAAEDMELTRLRPPPSALPPTWFLFPFPAFRAALRTILFDFPLQFLRPSFSSPRPVAFLQSPIPILILHLVILSHIHPTTHYLSHLHLHFHSCQFIFHTSNHSSNPLNSSLIDD